MAKVPQIRFKGFEGEWEKTSMGDLFSERVERSGEGEMLSVSIKKGVSKASDNDRVVTTSDLSNYKVVKQGDLAYNTMRMWQGACGFSDYDGIVSPAYTVAEPKRELMAYLSYMFRTESMLRLFRLNSQGLTSDNWNLKFPIFKNLQIHIPADAKEGVYIYHHLQSLDSLIASRQKELQKLKSIRKALLEQMFPQDGETCPKVRFSGFKVEWLKNTLKHLSQRVERKNSNLESTLPLCISAQLGLISQEEFYNNSVVGANIANYYLVKNGEFAYNKSSSADYPWGAIKRLDKYPQGILSTLYIVFVPSGEVKSDYLTTFFESRLWHDDVRKRASEGARNHGLLNISPEDFFKTEVCFPCEEEQEKFSKLFLNLDRLITARSAQVTKLQNLKRGMLERMFVNE